MAYPDLKNVQPVLEIVASECGVSIWGVEWTTEDGRVILRVYVEKEGGVNMETLTSFTRKLNLRLDETDPVPCTYTLEVSSPGLDRRLFTLQQCACYVGSVVKVKCTPETPQSRKRFKGRLAAVEEECLVLEDGADSARLPFSQVATAHLVYE
jgi:ribosome maturation factor RimP